ncbi:MAG: inorganic phosphate transporter, partial [Francisellaceae bacterium]
GFPVRTTLASSGSILWSGYPTCGVNWQVIRKMVTAWLLTLPCCMIMSFVIYHIAVMLIGESAVTIAI